eukprot:jgi/Chrzof1/15251/UNPLg00645.t1
MAPGKLRCCMPTTGHVQKGASPPQVSLMSSTFSSTTQGMLLPLRMLIQLFRTSVAAEATLGAAPHASGQRHAMATELTQPDSHGVFTAACDCSYLLYIFTQRAVPLLL